MNIEDEARLELELTARDVEDERRDANDRPGIPVPRSALEGEAESELRAVRRQVELGARAGFRDGPEAEVFLDGSPGFQCPTCGQVYEQGGICPVDRAELREVEGWVQGRERRRSVDAVMEDADRHYPSAR